MARFAQGTFKPKNPKKYVGNTYPIYRSSWELKMFIYLDEQPLVESWASEPIAIPYRSPLDGKIHKYHPDLLISYADMNGNKHIELIEIKPANQSIMEMAKSKQDKMTVALNHAKWEAARAFCKKNRITWRLVTERDLFFRK